MSEEINNELENIDGIVTDDVEIRQANTVMPVLGTIMQIKSKF